MKSFNFIPCLEAEISRGHISPLSKGFIYYQSENAPELIKESIVPPYGTPLSAVVDFFENIFFNSEVNLCVCPRLFAFNLKSKF